MVSCPKIFDDRSLHFPMFTIADIPPMDEELPLSPPIFDELPPSTEWNIAEEDESDRMIKMATHIIGLLQNAREQDVSLAVLINMQKNEVKTMIDQLIYTTDKNVLQQSVASVFRMYDQMKDAAEHKASSITFVIQQIKDLYLP